MLGLLLLYFIGKSFYVLAKPYKKNAWIFAIIGIAAYYFGTIIGGVCVGLFYAIVLESSSLEDLSRITLALIVVPFGLLTCWGLYLILKRNWTMAAEKGNENILDSDFKDQ